MQKQGNEVSPALDVFMFTNKICNEWKKTLKLAVQDQQLQSE